jgi:hypothetical protein
MRRTLLFPQHSSILTRAAEPLVATRHSTSPLILDLERFQTDKLRTKQSPIPGQQVMKRRQDLLRNRESNSQRHTVWYSSRLSTTSNAVLVDQIGRSKLNSRATGSILPDQDVM